MQRYPFLPFLILLLCHTSLLLANGSLTAEKSPLSLAEALALAAQQSEEVALAQIRERRASAERRQALAEVLPALSVTGTYTRRAREVTREVGGDTITVQARDAHFAQGILESTLVDFRAFPVLEAAARHVVAAALEGESVRRAVSFEVAKSYLAVLAFEQLVEAARLRVAVAEQTLRETRLRREAGLANRNDETRSELEQATARLQRTDLERQLALARLELSYWIGQEVDRPLQQPMLSRPAGDELSNLVGQALKRRSDVQALRERIEVARLATEAAARSWIPTLDFRGLYRWTNEAGLSGRKADWNLGLVLSWSLWDGGGREAGVEVRKTQLEEARLQLRQLERQVGREIEAALALEASAQAALEQAEVQARAARANAEEVRARFREGLATALEQADAQAALFEAAAQRARSQFALESAQLDLARAIGDSGPPFAPEGLETKSSQENG